MRPTHDPRWPEFAAAAVELGFGRKLLDSDAEYANHLGPALFALYRTGHAVGRGLSEPHRAMQRLCMTRLKAGRRAAGLCVECGADADGWRRCLGCRARNNERGKRNYRRFRGG